MKRINTKTKGKANSALYGALFAVMGLLLVSCSHKTRSIFFDIPPPEPKPEVEEGQGAVSDVSGSSGPARTTYLQGGPGIAHPADLEADRPPIEEIGDWEEALSLLPKTEKGKPDWSAALKDGTIMPRALDPADRAVEIFKLDFFIPAEKPKFEAYFPHSSHLEWMGCDSCHPAVFKYRDNEMSMKAIRKGEFCGKCHNSVAFSAKDCKRCHLSM